MHILILPGDRSSTGHACSISAKQRETKGAWHPIVDPGSVAYTAVDVCRRPRSGLAGVGVDFRKEQSPALGDLASGPALRAVGIGFHHEVQVITHDREGQHINGERLDLALDALFQPRTAVLGGIATEERPPHTAADQVKSPGSGILDDKAAGSGH